MNMHKKYTVHAYKYDGTLYRSWEFPELIKETEDYICIDTLNCKVISYKKELGKFVLSKTPRPTVWFIFKNEWYNILVSKRGKNISFYINVASPYIIEDDTIKYIDFDLDYQINNLAIKKMKELDMGEYLENSETYKYPENLRKKIMSVKEDIEAKFDEGKLNFYYQEDLFSSATQKTPFVTKKKYVK